MNTENHVITGDNLYPDGPRLLADIGGTNARFALETSPGRIDNVRVLACADYPTIDSAIRSYLEAVDQHSLRHAAIAIANPVDGDEIRMTNHDWRFSIEATRRALGFETLLVTNDFTALAMSLPHLKENQRVQIGGGRARANSVIGLIGAGTGLGVSGLIPADDRWISLGSEGGHVQCSPSDALESDILAYVRQEFSHVSAERLISGPGIVLIYRALCSLNNVETLPLDPPEVARRARSGECKMCQQALTVFSGMLGSFAADVAVTLGSLGGVFIGGGVVERLGELFDRDLFRKRFEAKGRFNAYMAHIPTFLITVEHPAFLGVSAILADELRKRSGHSPLFDKIRSARLTLSPAERRVADIVLEHPRSIISDPIAEIARQASVSQPTVIRFCRSLGCQGLSDFKLKLATGLTGTIPVSYSQVVLGDSASEFGAKVLDNTISAMLQVRENLNVAAVEKAIQLLQHARRIDFYAIGQWAIVAEDGQNKFLRFGIPTVAHGDAHIQQLSAPLLTKGDVVVAVSRTGKPADLLLSVDMAKKAGADVIGIAPAGSPLARHVTIAIETDPHLELDDMHMPMISRILHLALLDVLAVGVSVGRLGAHVISGGDRNAPRLPAATTVHVDWPTRLTNGND